MTITIYELLIYVGALAILFLTPGPVWVALIARAVSGGFQAAWPLAMGVVVGDVFWPLIAILGVSYLVSVYADFMLILRYVGAAMFLFMGYRLIRNADKKISSDGRLTKPGMFAGFAAGVAVILSNPKAVLFYMGVLPGIFDITKVNGWDMVVICLASMVVPLIGNLLLALFLGKVRTLLSTPESLRKLNMGSGIALVCVGLFIGLS